MKKKKVLSMLFIVFLLLSTTLTGCGGTGDTNAADQGTSMKPVTLSFANYLPAGNTFEEYVLKPFTDGLKEANIEIEYYPGSTLLDGAGMLEGIEKGAADIGMFAVTFEPGRFPISFMFDYPIKYASAEAASNTVFESLKELQPAELDGVKLLIPYASGPGIFLSKKPIRSINDFKGLEIRANSIQGQAMKTLGATPVTLPTAENYEAMRNGIVDAYVGAQEVGYALKLYELVSYGTYYPFGNVTFFVVMNEDKYNSLSPKQREIINQVSLEVFKTSASSYLGKTGRLTIDAVLNKGGEIITMEDKEIANIKNALSGILLEYAKKLDAKGLKGTDAMNRILEIAEKNNAKYPAQ